MKKFLKYIIGAVAGSLLLAGIVTATTITQVPGGGTSWGFPGGLQAHSVLVGNGLNPISTTTPGTSGQVLTSNGASSDPTFQTIAASPFPFTVNSWGNSTTSVLGFLNGFISTASSTFTGIPKFNTQVFIGTTTPGTGSSYLDVTSSGSGSVQALAIRSTPGGSGGFGANYNGITFDNLSAGNFKNQFSLRGKGVEKWAIGNDVNDDASNNFYIYNDALNASPFYIDASGFINTIPGGVFGFNNNNAPQSGSLDTGISRLTAGSFAFGTGAQGSTAGKISFSYSSSTAYSSFANASSTLFSAGTVTIPNLGTAAGTFLAADPNGKIIATTTPTGTGSSAVSIPVQYATTAALPANTYAGGVLTEVGTGALSVDGNSPVVGNRILVKNEVAQTNNGIYSVTATGSGIAAYALTRVSDYNSSANVIPGEATYVIGGTANVDAWFALTTAAPITVGGGGSGSNLTYVETNATASGVTSVGLSDSNSTLTIGSTPITTSGTITATLNLGHTNTWSVLQNFLYSSTTGYSSFAAASSTTHSIGTLTLPNLATAPGSFIAVDATGKVIATTTPPSLAFPWTPNATGNFNQVSNATTTQIHFGGSPISLSASSTAQFDNSSTTYASFVTASTTNFSIASSTYTNFTYIRPLRIGSSANDLFGEMMVSGAQTNNTPVSGTLYAFPTMISQNITVDEMAFDLEATGASSHVRIGIYTDNGNMYPNALVVDAGETNTGSHGLGTITLTGLSAKISPGLYWLVYENDGTSPQVRGPATGGLTPILGAGSSISTVGMVGWSVVNTYGALPGTFPGSAGLIGNPPFPGIFFRAL